MQAPLLSHSRCSTFYPDVVRVSAKTSLHRPHAATRSIPSACVRCELSGVVRRPESPCVQLTLDLGIGAASNWKAAVFHTLGEHSLRSNDLPNVACRVLR